MFKDIKECECQNSYFLKKVNPRFEGQSTTKSQFKAPKLQKPMTYEFPKVKERHYDPEVLKTNYRAEYRQVKPLENVNHGNVNPAAYDVVEMYKRRKNNSPFSSQTEYKESFRKNQIKLAEQPKYVYKGKDTKFEGTSSYKDEFVEKRNKDLYGGEQVSSYMDYYRQNKRKFQGKTSYQETFRRYDVKTQKQPEYKYKPKIQKFEGQTSYKSTYRSFAQKENKQLRTCPIHPQNIVINK